jgi:Helix-turn-helix domain
MTIPANLDLEMLDVRAAAALARRNPETVRRWVWSGRLAAQRRGRRILVARRDVVALAGGGSHSNLSLGEWARQAQASRKTAGPRRRGRSAADLVLEDRVQRSSGG